MVNRDAHTLSWKPVSGVQATASEATGAAARWPGSPTAPPGLGGQPRGLCPLDVPSLSQARAQQTSCRGRNLAWKPRGHSVGTARQALSSSKGKKTPVATSPPTGRFRPQFPRLQNRGDLRFIVHAKPLQGAKELRGASERGQESRVPRFPRGQAPRWGHWTGQLGPEGKAAHGVVLLHQAKAPVKFLARLDGPRAPNAPGGQEEQAGARGRPQGRTHHWQGARDTGGAQLALAPRRRPWLLLLRRFCPSSPAPR